MMTGFPKEDDQEMDVRTEGLMDMATILFKMYNLMKGVIPDRERDTSRDYPAEMVAW